MNRNWGCNIIADNKLKIYTIERLLLLFEEKWGQKRQGMTSYQAQEKARPRKQEDVKLVSDYKVVHHSKTKGRNTRFCNYFHDAIVIYRSMTL